MTCPECKKAQLLHRLSMEQRPEGLFIVNFWECPECNVVFTEEELDGLLKSDKN